MTTDQWGQVVRQQLGLGRLLPLGGPRDGAWITERAAGSALRHAAEGVRGVRLGTLRITLADPDETYDPAVPAPPSALPPGPLRIGAEFAAAADPKAPGAEPLPTTAARLRATLASTAAERLGLTVTEVDLRVTGLLDETAAPAEDADSADVLPDEPKPAAEQARPTDEESRVAAATLTVPGVTRLTGALGGLGRAVHIGERPGDATLPSRHVRVELAVDASPRTLDVARAVRTAVTEALPSHPSVAVVVTAVDGGK